MTNLTYKIIVTDKKTSMRLSPDEWEAIDIICERENISKNSLFEMISKTKGKKMGLTNSVRLFSLIYLHHLFIEKRQPHYSGKIKPSSPIFNAIKGII